MPRTLLINAGAAELRCAILEEGRLTELFLYPLINDEDSLSAGGCADRGPTSLVGNIYLGRVLRVMAGMQAALIDLGLSRAGFLGIREARQLSARRDRHDPSSPDIRDCVREGEEALVQAVKDPMGAKGPRLSANITIPGRLLVLAPQRPGIAASRRIESETERARLMRICEQMIANMDGPCTSTAGWILRSAAENADSAELQEDAARLIRTWQLILGQRKSARPPALLYREIGAIERILRDEVTADTTVILIDDRAALDNARDYCRRTMPAAESQLQFFSDPGGIFEVHGIEEEIERLISPRVALPSGGWITLESTEGFTAIDVNSGSFTGAAALEETALFVNLEAAAEIARQLRLRNIGGLIVADFIHLASPASTARLKSALVENLVRDRRATHVSEISQSGLVEITRKRMGNALSQSLTETCEACGGAGRRRSVQAIAYEILRAIERAAQAAPDRSILARAAPDVARWLADREEKIRRGLERRGAPRVQFEPDARFKREGYDVTTH